MGRKKSKRSHNQQRRQEVTSASPHTFTKTLDNLVVEHSLRASDLRSFSALSMEVDEFDKHTFPIGSKSSENISLSTPKIELAEKDAESIGLFSESSGARHNIRYSSYHDLVDGGAYKEFSSKFTTSISEADFNSAGDRVLAGSRSISHKTLFSKNRNLVEKHEVYPLINSRPNDSTGSKEKVRSYHTESFDTTNCLSRLSIHSNNDEFILIGGHPQYMTVPNGTIKTITAPHTDENSRSSSNLPIAGFKISDGYNSSNAIPKLMISSQESLELSSNTDDRLKLAAEHRLSPEAEGLIELENTSFCSTGGIKENQKGNVISEVNALSDVFISRNVNTSFPNAVQPNVLDSNARNLAQSSNNFHEHQSPQKALVVTSALTPLVPKRIRGSHNQSDDSVNLEPPETVQKVQQIKRIRPFLYQTAQVSPETKDMAVQTGNTIRLRQYPWTDVLSEYAVFPPSEKLPITIDFARTNPENTSGSVVSNDSADHSEPKSSKQHLTVQNDRILSFENLRSLETGEKSGDTIKKYIPKGRIRDLAAVFNNWGTTSKDQVELSSLPPKREHVQSIIKNTSVAQYKETELWSSEHSDCSTFSAFKNSAQNLNYHGGRLKSTSSSLHCPQNVFTRNTFVARDINSNNIKGSVRNVNYGNLDATEEVPSSRKISFNDMIMDDRKLLPEQRHPPVVDVPIRKVVPINQALISTDRKRHHPIPRAKTQEVLPVAQFKSLYPTRAISGDMYDTDDLSCLPLTRKLFETNEGDNLVNDKENLSEFRQPPRMCASTIVTHLHRSKYDPKLWKDSTYPENREPESIIATGSRNNMTAKEQKDHQMLKYRNIYSPPATEDAGSRITHHTSTTVQDDPFGTEESIRGTIDKIFDFVESDESRKHPRDISSSPSSVAFKEKYFPESERNDEKSRKLSGKQTADDYSGSLIDNDLEYSLSHYREIQRQQLRRRLPSADEPRFFRSPSISVPHAGQRVYAYETREHLGEALIGEEVREKSSNFEFGIHPIALATSTPLESPQSRSPFSPMYIPELKNNVIENGTFVSSISSPCAFDNKAEFAKRIDRLSYMIENTQKQMGMNEAALLDAMKKGRRMQEVAANRSILITRETLRLQRNELRRLHAFSAVRRAPPPMSKELRGTVVFRNLVIQLNKLFVSRLSEKDENSYSFVGLFKFGHIVEATELVPLCISNGDYATDEILFNKQIQFSDVPVDFMVTVEIYAMRLQPVKSVDTSIGAALANKCKNLMGPPQRKGHSQALETAFKFRGRLVLDRDASGDRSFYLDDVTYPLEGTVRLSTVCSRLPEAFETVFNGFLTMFHTISNMASWERYWAVIRRGTVFFWKYPDDEQRGQDPKMQIDLTKCTNNVIDKCEFELCPRANSFAIDLLVDADGDSVGSVVEKKRVLLSTDSAELMAQWLFVMNQTLDVIRGPI